LAVKTDRQTTLLLLQVLLVDTRILGITMFLLQYHFGLSLMEQARTHGHMYLLIISMLQLVRNILYNEKALLINYDLEEQTVIVQVNM